MHAIGASAARGAPPATAPTGLWPNEAANGVGCLLSRRFRRILRFALGGLACVSVIAADPIYVWTTLAGRASIGMEDGPAAGSRLFHPQGLALDNAGNLLVADTDNHTIRKVSPAGVVSTLAGLAGSLDPPRDGTGSDARFDGPRGLAVDSAGNAYVTDANSVRKITPSGVVSTLAGKPDNFGSTDGTGAEALFNRPNGIAVDAAGNVYVADTFNSTIRKITPAGVVSTLAGNAGAGGYALDGTGSDARFLLPESLAIDGRGNLYVGTTTFRGPNTVRIVSPAGVVTTFKAQNDANPLTLNIAGIAVDGAGNLIVSASDAIRRITPDGKITTLISENGIGTLGLPVDYQTSKTGYGLAGALQGVATDSGGRIYFCATAGNAVMRMTPAGELFSADIVAGADFTSTVGAVDGPGATARFWSPSGVCLDPAGNLMVADAYTSVIRKVTRAGLVSTIAGYPEDDGYSDGAAFARFTQPSNVAADTAGNLYVADRGNDTIRKITPAGVVSTLAGHPRSSGYVDASGDNARFYRPNGVTADAAGTLYVADYGNSTIRTVSPTGLVSTLPSLINFQKNDDAPWGVYGPFDVTWDATGNLFVACDDNTIRRITPAGVVSTLAGTPMVSGLEVYFPTGGTSDGRGPAAGFRHPQGLTTDRSGVIFVADTDNHTIRRITPAGDVTTIGGKAGYYGSTDGAAGDARFYHPVDVAADESGNLYVTDCANDTIRLGRILAAPVISGQPASFDVTPGTMVQFGVTVASAVPPTYQWYHGTGLVSGATASTLTISSAQSGDAGSYYVVVSNPAGSTSSQTATLSIHAASAGGSSGSGGGGGGGGAPSLYFLLMIFLLGIRRLRC